MPNFEQVYELAQYITLMKPQEVKEKNGLKDKMKLDGLFNDPGYAAEEKYDGIRCFTIANRIFTRKLIDITDKLPHIVEALNAMNKPNLVLDCEIYVPGGTSSDIPLGSMDADTAIAHQKKHGSFTLAVFEVLRAPSGRWMHNDPYDKRRAFLEYWYSKEVEGKPFSSYVHLTRQAVDNKKEFLAEIFERNGEGIVFKKRDSLYFFKERSPKWTWMKYKRKKELDVIITGTVEPDVRYNGKNVADWQYRKVVDGMEIPVSKAYYFGWKKGIEVSAYVDGELKYLGKITGITEQLSEELASKPEKYIGKVARISFMQLGSQGGLRHAKFLDLHPDKDPEECHFDGKDAPILE